MCVCAFTRIHMYVCTYVCMSIYPSIHLSIDCLPRRPNHDLTAVSFQVPFTSTPFSTPFSMTTWSWSDLGRSWGGLGRFLERSLDLGAFLDSLWAAFGCLGAVMSGSWSLQGRSRIDQEIDPKLDSNTGRIATEKMALELCLQMFQRLMGVTENQMWSPKKIRRPPGPLGVRDSPLFHSTLFPLRHCGP